MLKGCTKRVIVIKDTGSDLFDEAFFVIKPQNSKSGKLRTETDFVYEANKIISGRLSPPCKAAVTAPAEVSKKQRTPHAIRRDIRIFFSGAAIASAIAALVVFLL